MSVELRPGQYSVEPEEQALFGWLERDVRDHETLLRQQHKLLQLNPIMFHIMTDAAAELAPGDPKSHATYFGSFLLMLNDKSKQ